MSEKFLKNRVAFITGGASGMGRAIALKLAEAGCSVAVGSLLMDKKHLAVTGEIQNLPSNDRLSETLEEIKRFQVPALALNLDVCSTESVRNFFDETAEKLGNIDILVNAAGITAEQATCGHPEELWLKVMDVNNNGVFRTTRLCLPGMIQRKWGRIINIASTAASVGAVTAGAYCASKAAVVGYSRCVALEGAPHGVTCNTISPGWVQTDFGKTWMSQIATAENREDKESYLRDTIESNPQKRIIQPSEIAELSLYLCREEAKGMTMQDLTLSAGSLW